MLQGSTLDSCRKTDAQFATAEKQQQELTEREAQFQKWETRLHERETAAHHNAAEAETRQEEARRQFATAERRHQEMAEREAQLQDWEGRLHQPRPPRPASEAAEISRPAENRQEAEGRPPM